ncbi:MAG: hypothetical protein HY726_16090, partial [Candidatus Rokubacteria bacterium]|nr:hypothetical protein [Candidatus Rokubacteria bacterium]
MIGQRLKSLPRMLALLSFLGVALVGVPEAKSQPAPSGGLFGVAIIGGTPKLVSIDPMTGAVTHPVTAAANDGVSFPGTHPRAAQGISALDAATHRYFSVMEDSTASTSTRRLVVINTQTGDLEVDPPAALAHPFASLEFDRGVGPTGTLFGVAIIGGTPKLVSIDPLTGAVTHPVTGAADDGVSFPGTGPRAAQGISALDGATHQHFSVMEDSTATGSTRRLVV